MSLRSCTDARVALSRTGDAMSAAEVLRFQLDHARARDAVHAEMGPLGIACIELRSQAPDRSAYLRRPDLGRRLTEASRAKLAPGDYDAAIVICDGLSALAVERHAAALLDALRPRLPDWSLASVCTVRQGRVAVGDEIGALLGAKMVAVLIGERPGLSSPDSLGVYLTFDPRPGRTDAERNCISNIRAEGLGYEEAAHKLSYLMREARRRKLTGVALKEDAGLLTGRD